MTETTKPSAAATATKAVNLGALRISTMALLVVSFDLLTKSLNQRQIVFYFGPGARRVNCAGSQGGIPVKLANREREPSFWRHLDHVWWGSSGVPRAGDALHCAKWRHPNLNRVALGPCAQLFEQVTHGCGELGLISGAHRFNGRLASLWLDFSAHQTSMAVLKPR